MSGYFDLDTEARIISLVLEDIGNGWVVRLYTEPRLPKSRKRSVMRLHGRWFMPRQDRPIDNRDDVEAMIARAVQDPMLPGLG